MWDVKKIEIEKAAVGIKDQEDNNQQEEHQNKLLMVFYLLYS